MVYCVRFNKKNTWALWRGLSAVTSAIAFGLNRVTGRNKTATASRPITIDQEFNIKQTSLQVTPGLGDFAFRNKAFLINEAVTSWQKQNPSAQIRRVATSKKYGKINVTILYSEE